MSMDEMLKESVELHKVVEDLLLQNAYLQTTGDAFTLNRGGVAIPYIVSQPGAGKTASFASICKLINWSLVTVHLAMKPLEELGGIPNFKDVEINGKKYPGTIWTIPDLIGQLYQLANEPDTNGVFLCFDDIHLCGSMYLGLMQEFFTERTIRGYKIPDNTAIVLFGNSTNKAGAKTTSSAITNRCCMLPVLTSFDNWRRKFALGTNTDVPKLKFDPNRLRDVADKIDRVHPAIVSFLENDAYQNFFHEEEQVEKAWGSPRSWTRFSNWLMAYELVTGQIMDSYYCTYLGAGHVGKEGAAEFAKYYNIYSKFNIAEIFDNVDRYQLPSAPVDKYALAFAMSSYYCNHEQRKTLTDPFCKMVIKYIDEYKDMALIIVRDILDTEKLTKKKSIYMDFSMAINQMRPGITHELLEEVNNV